MPDEKGIPKPGELHRLFATGDPSTVGAFLDGVSEPEYLARDMRAKQFQEEEAKREFVRNLLGVELPQEFELPSPNTPPNIGVEDSFVPQESRLGEVHRDPGPSSKFRLTPEDTDRASLRGVELKSQMPEKAASFERDLKTIRGFEEQRQKGVSNIHHESLLEQLENSFAFESELLGDPQTEGGFDDLSSELKKPQVLWDEGGVLL